MVVFQVLCHKQLFWIVLSVAPQEAAQLRFYSVTANHEFCFVVATAFAGRSLLYQVLMAVLNVLMEPSVISKLGFNLYFRLKLESQSLLQLERKAYLHTSP